MLQRPKACCAHINLNKYIFWGRDHVLNIQNSTWKKFFTITIAYHLPPPQFLTCSHTDIISKRASKTANPLA
jgi:hypothetical protein